MRSSNNDRLFPNFFRELPRDLFQHLGRFLNLQGPRVELIQGKPTENQIKRVMATALDREGNADLSRPDLNVYHLICLDPGQLDEARYQIGFCRKKDDKILYQTFFLGDPNKDSLARYVIDDLQDPAYSTLFPESGNSPRYSRDRLLIQYIEAKIRHFNGFETDSNSHLGLVNSSLKNRENLALIQKGLLSQMKMQGLCQYNNTLEDALHYLVYAEDEKVMKILRGNVELLLSKQQAKVVNCAPEIVFHPISIFKLAYLTGNWFLWEEMLELLETKLSEEEKADFMADMLRQVNEVDEKGVPVDFDNLRNKGIRISDWEDLEANPEKRTRYQKDVKNRDSYHLIIKMTEENNNRQVEFIELCYLDSNKEYTSFFIYRDQKNKSLNQGKLLQIAPHIHSNLQNANQGVVGLYEHYFTRSTRDLAVVRAVLEKDLSVPTVCVKILKPEKFEEALKYLEIYDRDKYRVEQWHGEVMAQARVSFSAHVWRFWMAKENPGSLDLAEIENFVRRTNHSSLENINKEPLFPFTSLGDRYFAVGCYDVLGLLSPLLKVIAKVSEQKREDLKKYLQPASVYSARRLL